MSPRRPVEGKLTINSIFVFNKKVAFFHMSAQTHFINSKNVRPDNSCKDNARIKPGNEISYWHSNSITLKQCVQFLSKWYWPEKILRSMHTLSTVHGLRNIVTDECMHRYDCSVLSNNDLALKHTWPIKKTRTTGFINLQ